MDFKKITRVAIFIDHDNFSNGYKDTYDSNVDDNLWNKLGDELINYYRDNFIKNDFEVIEQTHTSICVGLSENPHSAEVQLKRAYYEKLDAKAGFVVTYGSRVGGSYMDPNTGKLVLGRGKGVDSEIVCQMLMGAFLNQYDACILLSDDTDYLPVLKRIHEYFGKKVIQAGFMDTLLSVQAYAHIPFGNVAGKMNLKKLAMRVVSDVLFGSGEDKLDPIATDKLDFIVNELKNNHNVSVTIHGHTDNNGTEGENLQLSEARAKAVADYITGKGIDGKRVAHIGHGAAEPVATNTTEEGRQRNRRVEFETKTSHSHAARHHVGH